MKTFQMGEMGFLSRGKMDRTMIPWATISRPTIMWSKGKTVYNRKKIPDEAPLVTFSGLLSFFY